MHTYLCDFSLSLSRNANFLTTRVTLVTLSDTRITPVVLVSMSRSRWLHKCIKSAIIDANMQLIIHSFFCHLFTTRFSPTPTLPRLVSKSQTFPAFPDEWSPCVISSWHGLQIRHLNHAVNRRCWTSNSYHTVETDDKTTLKRQHTVWSRFTQDKYNIYRIQHIRSKLLQTMEAGRDDPRVQWVFCTHRIIKNKTKMCEQML